MSKHSLAMLVGLEKPYSPPPPKYRRAVSTLTPEDDEDVLNANSEMYKARKKKLLNFLRVRGEATGSDLRPVLGMAWGNLTNFLDEMAILGVITSREERVRGLKRTYWRVR